MKVTSFLCYLFSALLLISCSGGSSSSGESPEFRFLELEKNVLLQSVGSGEVTFLALDFDRSLSAWQITLVEDTLGDIPVTLNSIEDTPYGYTATNSIVQRISVGVPALGTGNYELTIENVRTGQFFVEPFLVRAGVFNDVDYEFQADLSLTPGSSIADDWAYFHNVKKTINSEISTTSIEAVVLENKQTMVEYDVAYEINSTTNKVEFTIPDTVPVGTYFLSVQYSSSINTYYVKDIVVVDEQLPVITSINQTDFMTGDSIVIDGESFRYSLNPTLVPGNGLQDIRVSTYLEFRDVNGERLIHFDPYDNNSGVNAAGTQISLPISEIGFYTDAGMTYFEGEVVVRSGPYVSEPVAITIVY
ncbi:MAG: hypothetical protein HWE27_13980 [Gammaproteobacteria bacterium]|nr:hypothetical protein [Gammaproteobacteria bacterium]